MHRRDALAVRSAGGKARELADRHFFETLVRIHRAGEGEGFTGFKPAGTVEPGIAAADIHFVEEADRLARRGAPHVHHDEPAHQDSP